MYAVFKVSELALWKIHGAHKVLLHYKKSIVVLFNVTAEPANCSLFFFEKSRKTFLQFDLQK